MLQNLRLVNDQELIDKEEKYLDQTLMELQVIYLLLDYRNGLIPRNTRIDQTVTLASSTNNNNRGDGLHTQQTTTISIGFTPSMIGYSVTDIQLFAKKLAQN
jgi:hypothetical protein